MSKTTKLNHLTGLGRRLTAVLMLPLFALLVMPVGMAAAAPDEAKIDKMSVLVEPEYDDPRVLAVYQATLSQDTKLPRKAKFYVSKNTPDIQIGMACEIPEGQGHRCKVYDTVDAGDYNELTYQVDTARNLFFEYYWDPFKEAKDNKRGFTYDFKAPFAINELEIQIQKPLKGQEFKVEPATENLSKDEEGFEYSTYSFKDVKPDQTYTFNVNYTSGGVSKSKTIPANDPNNPNTLGQTTGNPTNVRIMLFLFILLFVGGILAVYWRSKLTEVEEAPAVAPRAGRPKKAAAVRTTGGSAKAAKPKFCVNCGNELEKGNRFCAECGTEVA